MSISNQFSPIHLEGQFSPSADHDIDDVEEEFFLECEEFWWDEEERHNIF